MKKAQYTETQMRAAYLDWQQSGLSKKGFCAQRSIPCSTFHYWIKKFVSKDASSASGFLELNMPKAGMKGKLNIPEIEIEYPSGVKIRLFSFPDATWIKSLS